MNLNDLFLKYLSTKSSVCGNFAKRYEYLFEPFKDKDIKLLEIGVSNCASLRTWYEYFTKATIVGLEIADINYLDLPDNVKILKGSQSDENIASEIAKEFSNFDIIIEDGSTLQCDKIKALDLYFNMLNSGGIYIVEHTQHSYERRNGGSIDRNSQTIMNRLKELTDIINFYEHVDNDTGSASKFNRGDYRKIIDNANWNLSNIELYLDSIQFFCGMAVLRKR